jgi:hypothetical protein
MSVSLICFSSTTLNYYISRITSTTLGRKKSFPYTNRKKSSWVQDLWTPRKVSPSKVMPRHQQDYTWPTNIHVQPQPKWRNTNREPYLFQSCKCKIKVLPVQINSEPGSQRLSRNSFKDSQPIPSSLASRHMNIWRGAGMLTTTSGELFCGLHLTNIFEQLTLKGQLLSAGSSAHGGRLY